MNNIFNLKLTDKFSNLILVFIILSFPFSDNLFLFLRLQDIFVLIFIFFNLSILNDKEIKLVLLILSILVFSNIFGLIIFQEFYYVKIALFYKIIVPVIFLIQVNKLIKINNFRIFDKYIDIIFIIYLTYIFFIYNWNFNGLIPKPYWPGSIKFFGNALTSDNHLMSVLVGFFLSLKIFFTQKEKKYFNLTILWFLFINFMLLFESRVFVLFIITFIYIYLNQIFNSLKQKNLFQIFFYFFLLLIISYFLIEFQNLKKTINLYEFEILKKLISFQTLEIGPHANRVTSFFLVAPDNIFYLITGVGFLFYPYLFLDSGIILIFSSFGILGLFLTAFFLLKKFNISLTDDFNLNLIFILVIFINLFVAEYFIVSRFIYVVLILYKLSSIKSQLFLSKHIDKE